MAQLQSNLIADEITEEDFDIMGNDDGDVDRTEFIIYMVRLTLSPFMYSAPHKTDTLFCPAKVEIDEEGG